MVKPTKGGCSNTSTTVSVMDRFGGWQTCKDLTDTLRSKKSEAVQIAEYWPVNDYVVKPSSIGGAGFDATWNDAIRDNVRAAIGQASAGGSTLVSMDLVAGAFQKSIIGNRWRAVDFIENHDIVREGRQLRIPRLADGSNPRSWYARSRSRLAMGAGLENGDKNMGDFLRFTRELVALRRRQPALRGEGLAIVHVHSQNRVLALQRWIEGVGRDVIVVYNLSETNWYNYQLGFPGPGRWVEVFNSDVYDNWVNPMVSGNGGGIEASGGPLHGLSSSASATIPANGFVVFARDAG